MTRPKAEFDEAASLIQAGLNDCAISRLSGIPRTTIRDWRRAIGAGRTRSDGSEACLGHDPEVLPTSSYAYLLGLYLGDGCISAGARTFRMRVTLDQRYPLIIDACAQAMEKIVPWKRAHRVIRKGCIDVSMYWNHWPCLFPQHGPGRKHERPIILEPWQETIVQEESELFLRGLIHSDGCRIVANDRGCKSIRYAFSNRSEDIKRLFCDALDRLSIAWTRPCARQIAIYRKAAAARLDEFIGPKT